MSDLSEIYERLESVRRDQGLPAYKFSEEIGRANLLAEMKRGRVQYPPASCLIVLAEKFNINPGWILTGRGPKKFASGSSGLDERATSELKGLMEAMPEAAILLLRLSPEKLTEAMRAIKKLANEDR